MTAVPPLAFRASTRNVDVDDDVNDPNNTTTTTASSSDDQSHVTETVAVAAPSPGPAILPSPRKRPLSDAGDAAAPRDAKQSRTSVERVDVDDEEETATSRSPRKRALANATLAPRSAKLLRAPAPDDVECGNDENGNDDYEKHTNTTTATTIPAPTIRDRDGILLRSGTQLDRPQFRRRRRSADERREFKLLRGDVVESDTATKTDERDEEHVDDGDSWYSLEEAKEIEAQDEIETHDEVVAEEPLSPRRQRRRSKETDGAYVPKYDNDDEEDDEIVADERSYELRGRDDEIDADERSYELRGRDDEIDADESNRSSSTPRRRRRRVDPTFVPHRDDDEDELVVDGRSYVLRRRGDDEVVAENTAEERSRSSRRRRTRNRDGAYLPNRDEEDEEEEIVVDRRTYSLRRNRSPTRPTTTTTTTEKTTEPSAAVEAGRRVSSTPTPAVPKRSSFRHNLMVLLCVSLLAGGVFLCHHRRQSWTRSTTREEEDDPETSQAARHAREWNRWAEEEYRRYLEEREREREQETAIHVAEERSARTKRAASAHQWRRWTLDARAEETRRAQQEEEERRRREKAERAATRRRRELEEQERRKAEIARRNEERATQAKRAAKRHEWRTLALDVRAEEQRRERAKQQEREIMQRRKEEEEDRKRRELLIRAKRAARVHRWNTWAVKVRHTEETQHLKEEEELSRLAEVARRESRAQRAANAHQWKTSSSKARMEERLKKRESVKQEQARHEEEAARVLKRGESRDVVDDETTSSHGPVEREGPPKVIGEDYQEDRTTLNYYAMTGVCLLSIATAMVSLLRSSQNKKRAAVSPVRISPVKTEKETNSVVQAVKNTTSVAEKTNTVTVETDIVTKEEMDVVVMDTNTVEPNSDTVKEHTKKEEKVMEETARNDSAATEEDQDNTTNDDCTLHTTTPTMTSLKGFDDKESDDGDIVALDTLSSVFSKGTDVDDLIAMHDTICSALEIDKTANTAPGKTKKKKTKMKRGGASNDRSTVRVSKKDTPTKNPRDDASDRFVARDVSEPEFTPIKRHLDASKVSESELTPILRRDCRARDSVVRNVTDAEVTPVQNVRIRNASRPVDDEDGGGIVALDTLSSAFSQGTDVDDLIAMHDTICSALKIGPTNENETASPHDDSLVLHEITEDDDDEDDGGGGYDRQPQVTRST